MDTVAQELTAAQLLSWAKTFLDYTDAIVNDLPEDDESLDWRQTDDSGGWYFSIREQAMHIADTRHDAIGWITGEDTDEHDFCTEYGGVEKPWQFRKASRDEIIARMKSGRELVDSWLNRPHGVLMETSDHLIKQHEESIESLRKVTKDTSEREARGPSLVINVILFLVSHEQSHRALLQNMLRQRGHKVTRYA
jgi:uncharacterized damage-inducible protein DinB